MGRILEGIRHRAPRHLERASCARSLSVLGNIVAVTSIIAVVSLVQGLNAYGDRRHRVGRGRRLRSRRGPLRHHAATTRTLEKGAQQPADHAPGRGGHQEVQPFRALGHGREQPIRQASFRDHLLESVNIRGVSPEEAELFVVQRRARPPAQPERGRAQPQRRAARLGNCPKGCWPGWTRSARRLSRSSGLPLPSHRREREEGDPSLGSSLDKFAIIPFGASRPPPDLSHQHPGCPDRADGQPDGENAERPGGGRSTDAKPPAIETGAGKQFRVSDCGGRAGRLAEDLFGCCSSPCPAWWRSPWLWAGS